MGSRLKRIKRDKKVDLNEGTVLFGEIMPFKREYDANGKLVKVIFKGDPNVEANIEDQVDKSWSLKDAYDDLHVAFVKNKRTPQTLSNWFEDGEGPNTPNHLTDSNASKQLKRMEAAIVKRYEDSIASSRGSSAVIVEAKEKVAAIAKAKAQTKMSKARTGAAAKLAADEAKRIEQQK